ncbi:M23 family metallopeptidase [Endozoicomonas sp.]|nr:M23 family metallopeptidase [Endozoicomonas sp.]
MKVIVVNNDHAQTYSFQATGFRLAVAGLLLVVIIAAIGGGGAYAWLKASNEGLLTYEGVRNWKEVLGDQKQGLASVKQETERQLDALTLRLAQLQGRITRLDALGERLIVKSNLNDGEFDFSEAPALGGPAESPEVSNLYAKPTLIDAIDQLAIQIDSREQQLDLLDSLIANQMRHNDTFVAGIPVEKGWLSSRFGRRTDPFTGKAAWHNGIDFAGKKGTPILAMAAGVVTWAGDRSGYGLLVEVNHGNSYVTRYAHSESVDVKVGDIVKRGQVVAKMGSTGRSTGNHVHVEVLKNGKQADPARYIYRETMP